MGTPKNLGGPRIQEFALRTLGKLEGYVTEPLEAKGSCGHVRGDPRPSNIAWGCLCAHVGKLFLDSQRGSRPVKTTRSLR